MTTGDRRVLVALCVALAALATVPYLSAGSFEFVSFDDTGYVVDNPLVNQGLRWEAVGEAFTKSRMANWHPLTWVSHMLDCSLFGLEPGGHHLMNVGIHALNAVLLLLALHALTGSVWKSALVAALFAVHPLRAESVAWVSERKDVLSGSFWMLALWVYARHARRPTETSFGVLLLVFALGLLAKPMLVTLPCVLLLLDFWPLRGLRPLRAVLQEKAWMLLLGALAALATVFAQDAGAALKSVEIVGFADRILNAFNAYVMYVVNSFWPTGLAFFYPHPGYIGRPHFSQAMVSLALLVTTTIWVVRRRRLRPWLLVGWLWFLGTLVPVIGIMQVGEQSRADRYTYLTTIGLGIMLAWELGAWATNGKTSTATRARVRVACGLSLAALASLTVAARAQASTWQDNETLYKHALTVTEDNYTAHLFLGAEYLAQDELELAEQHCLAAITAEERLPQAHQIIGQIHLQRGNEAAAERSFKKTLQWRPKNSQAHNNLGILMAQQGRFEEALQHLRVAVKSDPENEPAAKNLVNVRAMRRKEQLKAQAPSEATDDS